MICQLALCRLSQVILNAWMYSWTFMLSLQSDNVVSGIKSNSVIVLVLLHLSISVVSPFLILCYAIEGGTALDCT